MRGRGAEFETVLGLLDSAAGPGPGLARRRRTGHREVAAAGPGWRRSRPSRFSPGCRGGQRRAGHAGERRRPPRDDGARAWADVVLTGLEELASAGPVLVTADDV